MVPGVLLEPYMSQGDQGVAETPIVSKGLIIYLTSFIRTCTCQLSTIMLLIYTCIGTERINSINEIIVVNFNRSHHLILLDNFEN